jgi:hypothetical protein
MNTVKQGVGLDHESRHRLDLAVEEKLVGIDVRAAIIVIGGRYHQKQEGCYGERQAALLARDRTQKYGA